MSAKPFLFKEVFLIVLGVFYSCSDVCGQNFREWVGSGNWQDFNWSGGNYTYGQLEWKGNGASTSNNNDSPASQWRLYFNNSVSYTITGNQVNLYDFSGANSWVLSDASAIQHLNLPIGFLDGGSRPAWITTRNSGGFNFTNINVGGNVTYLHFSGQQTSGSITVNGELSGSKPIIIGKDNTDALQSNTRVIFAGSNTYTGETYIDAGNLRLTNANSLGSTVGGTTVVTGSTLEEAMTATFPTEQLNLSGFGISGLGAVRKTSTGTNMYNCPILLVSDSRINVDAGKISYNSTIDFNGNTLYIGGDEDFEFVSSTPYFNASKTTGDGTLFKDGNGVLILKSHSNLIGNITLNQGEIRQSGSALSTNASLILRAGTTYRANTAAPISMPKALKIEGDITLGTIGSGSINFTGSIDLSGANHTITIENSNTFSGVISNGGIIKAGSGNLNITNGNNYAGVTEILDGSITLTHNGAVKNSLVEISNPSASLLFGATATYRLGGLSGSRDINMSGKTLEIGANNATSTYSGSLSNGNLTKMGNGVLTLSGDNTYTGNTTLNAGTLQLGASDRIADGSNLVFNGGQFHTGGFNEIVGTIDVNNNSVLTLGATTHQLHIAASASTSWVLDMVLTIYGWSGNAGSTGLNGKIYIGNDASGLTALQLTTINFDGYGLGAELLSDGELVPRIQTVNPLDNFNRANSNTVGTPSNGLPDLWIETDNLNGGVANTSYIRLNSNLLELRNCIVSPGDGGSKSAAYDVTGLYATVFEEAAEPLEWYFNMRQNQTDIGGFGAGSYGMAFVIGANESNLGSSTVDGYAVVLGETGMSDEIRLIHFTNGFPASPVANTIASILPVGVNNNLYYSVRVSFNPCNNEWGLTVLEDGVSAFSNPFRISGVPGATGVNTNNIGLNLNYVGGFFTHNDACTNSAVFDNIYIPSKPSQITNYVWTNPSGGDFQNAVNWTPTRTCPRRKDILTFNALSTTITNVPSQTIGQLIITGSSNVRLRDVSGDELSSVLSFNGGSGADLNLETGSVLIMDVAVSNDSEDGIEILINTGHTGLINGILETRNSNSGTVGRPHRLMAADAGGIQVNGKIAVVDLNGHLFGDSGINNTISFNSGSYYDAYDGANPFGLSQPNSKVIFNAGSTYTTRISTLVPSLTGRTYANFECNYSGTLSVILGGSNAWTVDNILMTSGNFNIAPAGLEPKLDINCKASILANSGTLTINPGDLSTLRFNGNITQTISGAGAIIFGDSLDIELNNSNTGVALNVGKNISLARNLTVTDGVIQGMSPGYNLTMTSDFAILNLNDAVNGTNVGPGNDLSLILSGNRTNIIGNSSNCDFLNITLGTNDTLAISKGIECIYGSFNIGTGSKLIIEAGGFIANSVPGSSRSPLYTLTSQLIYNSGSSYGRGMEWAPNTLAGDAGCPGDVIIQNGTILYTDNDVSVLTNQRDIILGYSGGIGTLNMSDDAAPLQVGRDLLIGSTTFDEIGSFVCSSLSGADVRVRRHFNLHPDPTIGYFASNEREIVMNGVAAQTISGKVHFDYLAIANTSTSNTTVADTIFIDNRLRLSDGQISGGSRIKMADNSLILREDAGSTIASGSPQVISGQQYNIRYTGELTTGLEWSADINTIRDVRIEALVTLNANKSLNRSLILDGANLDLAARVLAIRGLNLAPTSVYSGSIEVRQPGTRLITSSTSGRIEILGNGGLGPDGLTKEVLSFNGAELVFDSNVEVWIGNGGVNFGLGNPTTIKGVLALRGGGFVEDNSCYYADLSVLRFDSGFDYQVDDSDLLWSTGVLNSGLPGIPYNVEVIGTTTDLTLNAPRSLRNSLTITNGKFTLTSESGTFRLGGNWTRSGVGSAFVHNDQEVIFDGISPATQTIASTGGEIFYALSFEHNGVKTLSQDVRVLNDITIRSGAVVDATNTTIELKGNWNNEIGHAAFSESTSTLNLTGNTIQDINSPNGERLFNLTINSSNAVALELTNEIQLAGNLTLTDGIIRTADENFVFQNDATSSIGHASSYIDGRISKVGLTLDTEFTFPSGDYNDADPMNIIDVFQPAGLIANNTDATAAYDVEYFHQNHNPAYNNPLLPPPSDPTIPNVSTCNYWIIDKLNPASTDAKVKLYWNEQTCITITDASLLTVARFNGLEWDNQSDTEVWPAMPPYTSGYVISGVVTSFSPFTFASTSANFNVLPIELLYFTAKPEGKSVRTDWVTLSETNNSHFTVERSIDAINFEPVGELPGAGNSTSQLEYVFSDDQPYMGISYYRLKQTDLDGQFTYSDVRSVEISGDSEFELRQVYQSQSGVNIRYISNSPHLFVEIYDMIGRRVFETSIYQQGFQAQIYPNLAMGMYILRLSNGRDNDSKKFFFVK